MDRNIHHWNENYCPVNIYLVFSKAFDSLNSYDVFLSKLTYYGLQQSAIRLQTGYLFDRCQYVQLDNVKSSKHSTTCGIPQGSVLGSLFFNMLINDISLKPQQSVTLLCTLMTPLCLLLLKILEV